MCARMCFYKYVHECVHACVSLSVSICIAHIHSIFRETCLGRFVFVCEKEGGRERGGGRETERESAHSVFV